MTALFSRERRVFIGILLLPVLVAGLFWQRFYAPTKPIQCVTMAEGFRSDFLWEMRAKHAQAILPPTDYDKAAAILAQSEKLWSELLRIKAAPDFRETCNDEDSPYQDWRRRVYLLLERRPCNTVIGDDVHFLPVWLLAVGTDYATNPNFGKRDSVIEDWLVNYHLPATRQSVLLSD